MSEPIKTFHPTKTLTIGLFVLIGALPALVIPTVFVDPKAEGLEYFIVIFIALIEIFLWVAVNKAMEKTSLSFYTDKIVYKTLGKTKEINLSEVVQISSQFSVSGIKTTSSPISIITTNESFRVQFMEFSKNDIEEIERIIGLEGRSL